MGLIFNVAIVLCLILHQTSSAQAELKEHNHYEIMKEIVKLNEKVSHLMEEVANFGRNHLNLEKKVELIKPETEKLIAQKIEKVEVDMKQMETSMDQELSELALKLSAKIEEHVSGLNVKLSKLDQHNSWLNETVERVSNWTKINSDDIDSIKQCLSPSIKKCREDKIPHLYKPNQREMCNVTKPSQLYRLSADTLVYTWEHLNYSDIANRKDKAIESEVFSIDKLGINAQLKIEIEHYYIRATPRVVRKNLSDKWTIKVNPRVTYVIKRKKQGQIMDSQIRSDEFNNLGSPSTYDTYDVHSSIIFYGLNSDSKHETFSIEVHVDTPEMSNRFYSDDGKVKGSICPYWEIRRMSFDRVLEWMHSPYVYTSPKGHRAVVSMKLYEEEYKETRLHVFFSFLSGAYHSLLEKPQFKATFTLVNQRNLNKSLTQVSSSYLYSMMFLFRIPYDTSEFVVNDELKYEASIEMIN